MASCSYNTHNVTKHLNQEVTQEKATLKIETARVLNEESKYGSWFNCRLWLEVFAGLSANCRINTNILSVFSVSVAQLQG